MILSLVGTIIRMIILIMEYLNLYSGNNISQLTAEVVIIFVLVYMHRKHFQFILLGFKTDAIMKNK